MSTSSDERPSAKGGWKRVADLTRLYGVWGHPVGHSLSPAIHNPAFERAKIAAVYLAFDVAPADLDAAVEGARALGLSGWNVTVPHKESILHYLDELAPSAERIGAVNTVVRTKDDRLVGHNTDGVGFVSPLRSRLGFDPAERRVVILGAGGAARAVAVALLDTGATAITILNRTRARAEALVADLTSLAGDTEVELVADGLEEPVDHPALASCDLLVQSTSRGLGDASPLEIRWDRLPEGAIVADLVYGREPTFFLREASQHGHQTHDGLWMLIGQANEAFRLWTGECFDPDAIHAGIEDRLSS